MISEQALALALSRNLLTTSQVESLRRIEAELRPARLDPPDEEKLRFISGFGDIFVSIGLVLFLGAIAYFGDTLSGFRGGGPIAMAIASWLLAEFFTLRRRMALPSILLLIAFSASIFFAAADLIYPEISIFDPEAATSLTVGGIGMAIGALLHYARFHVPITVAAGTAGLVAIIAGLLRGLGFEMYTTLLHPVLFLCGIAVFAVAMRFDMADPLRQTRRTDIAFWLHLLAAPLIVHPVLSRMLESETLTSANALAILSVFVMLAGVAILVNRRAILVSGLAYAGYAFGTLIDEAGLSDTATPLTLLALGTLVLLLSAGWNVLRSRILRAVPERLRSALPPDLAQPA